MTFGSSRPRGCARSIAARRHGLRSAVIDAISCTHRTPVAHRWLWISELHSPLIAVVAQNERDGGSAASTTMPIYSIDGSTRSGGLWPSTKVLMLTMTFSPMSMRPSSVAEPMCGSSTTLPVARELGELRIDRRLVLEHVEAGAGDLAAADQADQRVLVDHFAARGVDDVGLRPDQLEAARRQQVIGRRRVRAIDRDDVHARQHLVEAFPVGRVELLLDLRRDPAAVVIVDLQAEGARAPRHRLADPAHADDAEPLAPDAVAEHPGRRPAGPLRGRSVSTRAPSASRRGTARISAMVMSAVSSVRTPGVLVTVMPRCTRGRRRRYGRRRCRNWRSA